MTKTPEKMLKYLKKIDNLGLKQVRVIVPADDEHKVAAYADTLRHDYLNKIATTADADDPRLQELATGRLASAIKPAQIAAWRQELSQSQHILFDRKVLTMQQEWSKMVLAVQAKHAAIMRGETDTERHSALAAVAAMSYRSAKDDLMQYVAANAAA